MSFPFLVLPSRLIKEQAVSKHRFCEGGYRLLQTPWGSEKSHPAMRGQESRAATASEKLVGLPCLLWKSRCIATVARAYSRFVQILQAMSGGLGHKPHEGKICSFHISTLFLAASCSRLEWHSFPCWGKRELDVTSLCEDLSFPKIENRKKTHSQSV